MMPAKVAALITRQRDTLTEICVFDHAGFVQLPAGTLHAGEDPAAGALREAWEETGLPHLEVAGEVATLGEFDGDGRADVAMMIAAHEGCPIAPGHTVRVLDRNSTTATVTCDFYAWTGPVDVACITRDVTRHVFHLRTTTATSDEWWVVTPDGHGSQWRCHWVPLNSVLGLHESQRRWLDTGRHFEPAYAVDRLAPLPAGVTELFWAPPFGGHRALCIPHQGRHPASHEAIGSCIAAAITVGGHAVVVTSDPTLGWGFPGGRSEPGERVEETMIREVGEEACARVLDCELLFTNEFVHLDDDRNETLRSFSPNFWARVELDEWEPHYETVARRCVPLNRVHSELRWEAPPYLELLTQAQRAEEQRSRPR